MKTLRTAIVAAASLLSAAALQAHHSYAMFAMNEVATVRGVVSTLEWVNPHAWLWVDVDDGKGGKATYGFETVSPGQLQRDYGWTRQALKIGDTVTVDYAPLRSGNKGGALVKVTLPDGRVLATRFSNPGAAAAPTPGAPAKQETHR